MDSESYALTLERFLTIYYNRSDNELGYDLSINNNYNPIIGDILPAKQGKLSGALNPAWLKIPPLELAKAIKTQPTMDSIKKRFNVNSHTINSRIGAYGFIVKGERSLTDSRAYFLKPLIKEGIKKGFYAQQFIDMCLDRDFTFFKDFTMKKYFLNQVCEYIWHDMFEEYDVYNDSIKSATYSRVRKWIIAIELLDIMGNPLINTIKKAKKELTVNFELRYETELSDILRRTVGEGYTSIQDRILKEKFTQYLEQINPILTLEDILLKFNLPLTSDNLAKIRHKIYPLFQINSIEKIRKIFWHNHPIFRLFGDRTEQLIKYISKSLSKLRDLFEHAKTSPVFTIKSLSNAMSLDLRTIRYHLKTNLIPLGLVELDHLEGAKGYFKLTVLGEKFLDRII